jgi:hypothetical protein
MRKAVVSSWVAVVPFLAFLASLLTAVPAVAGQLIVPVACSGASAEGWSGERGTCHVKLWLSNQGPADDRADVTFVESGAEGAARRSGAIQVEVPAGRTVLLSDLAPDGKSGRIEVVSRAELQASARLERVGAGGRLLSSTGVQVLSPVGSPLGETDTSLRSSLATAAGEAVRPRAAGVIVFTVPGLFLHATAANSLASYALPVRPGVRYQRATVDFDLTIREFNKVLLFTGVTSLRRPANRRLDRVLYYAMQLVNRNQKTVLDLGVQDRLARTQGPWQAGHTYHLRFTYDLRQRVVRLDVFENGQHIYELHGPALHPDLSANANPLTVDFGQTGIGDGAYGPPLGWDYANLSLRLDP